MVHLRIWLTLMARLFGTATDWSLIFWRVHSAWIHESVKTSVDVVSAVKGSGEALRSRVVLGRQVFLLGYFGSVGHARRLINQVFLQSLLWVLHVFRVGWELPRDHILSFKLLVVVLYSSVNLGVELAVFPHFFQGFVLESAHWIFESQISLSLESKPVRELLQKCFAEGMANRTKLTAGNLRHLNRGVFHPV